MNNLQKSIIVKNLSFVASIMFVLPINGGIVSQANANPEYIETIQDAKDMAENASGNFFEGENVPYIKRNHVALPIIDEATGKTFGYIIADMDRLVFALRAAGYIGIASTITNSETESRNAHSESNQLIAEQDDKDSAIEAYKVLKPAQKKTNNLHEKSNPIALLGKDAVQNVAYNNIDTENKIIGKSMIDNTNEAYRTFYTIQTGSFKNMTSAQRQFNTLIKFSYKKEFDHLRIERINKFNVVRFGKFEGYSNAVKLIKKMKPYIANAFILEAYIKDENITKLHKK